MKAGVLGKILSALTLVLLTALMSGAASVPPEVLSLPDPPVVSIPQPKSTFGVGEPVELTWSATSTTPKDSEPVLYLVEVTRDGPQLSDIPVLHETTNGTSFTFELTDTPGTYRWHVHAIVDDKTSVQSASIMFWVVGAKTGMPAGQVVLSGPADRSMVEYGASVGLRWTDVGATSYTLSIYIAFRGGAPLAWDLEVPYPEFRFTGLQPGLARWQVTPRGPAGEVYPASETRLFFISDGRSEPEWPQISLADCTPVDAGPPLPPGTVVGSVLETDIVAEIDGNLIPSWNVDNDTVVMAEDLANYGLGVFWHSGLRRLDVFADPGKPLRPLAVQGNKSVHVGRRAGDIFATDIRCYLDDREVKSYNLGGRTAVRFEDLGRYGRVEWDPAARRITLTRNW